MKIKLLSLMLVSIPVLLHAWNPNLYLRGISGFLGGDVIVSSVDVRTRVCGLYAYSEMTIVFEDSAASPHFYEDSMMLSCNIRLPERSVVDSMSLWVAGKPESAFLLDKQRVWAKPAHGGCESTTLTILRGSHSYNLRIFPLTALESKTVKINFSSPLVPDRDLLTLSMPFDFIAASLFAPSEVRWEIKGDERYSGMDIGVDNVDRVNVEKSISEGKPVLVARALDYKMSSTVRCTFRDPLYADSGYVATLASDNGQTWFTAMVNVEKAFKMRERFKKKVLFLWNCVDTRTQIVPAGQNDSCSGTKLNSDCHLYFNLLMVNSYNAGSLADGRNALQRIINTTLFNGDSFNIVLNDGSLKTFNENGFTAVTGTSLSGAVDFAATAPSAQDDSSGNLTDFGDLLKATLRSDKVTDSTVIVIVDGAEHYLYTYDTLVLKNLDSRIIFYHYRMKDTIDLEALPSQVIAELPEHVTVYGVVNPTGNYSNAGVYSELALARNGGMLSVRNAQDAAERLLEYMVGKLDSAEVAITAPDNSSGFGVVRYIVDEQIEYNENTLPAYRPLFMTGKLSGNPHAFTIDIKGAIRGTAVHFNKNFPAQPTCFTPAQREVWASLQFYYSMEGATALGHTNHILTDSTILVVLEPGTDTLHLPQVSNDCGVLTPHVEKPYKQTTLATQMTVDVGRKGFCIHLHSFRQFSSMPVSLKVYDIKGRCIANLASILSASDGTISFARENITKGCYVFLLTIGKVAQHKFVTIVE